MQANQHFNPSAPNGQPSQANDNRIFDEWTQQAETAIDALFVWKAWLRAWQSHPLRGQLPDTLQKHLEEYQNQQAELQHPLIVLLETNRTKQADLEAQKERLITAYTAGVLSLDEIAAQKVDLDRQIGELIQAIEALQNEL